MDTPFKLPSREITLTEEAVTGAIGRERAFLTGAGFDIFGCADWVRAGWGRWTWGYGGWRSHCGIGWNGETGVSWNGGEL